MLPAILQRLILMALIAIWSTQTLAAVHIDYEIFCGDKPDSRWPGKRFMYIDDIVLNGAHDGTNKPITSWRACNTSTKFELSVLLYEDYLRQENDLENFEFRILPKERCFRVFRTQDVKFKAIENDASEGNDVPERVLVLYCDLKPQS